MHCLLEHGFPLTGEQLSYVSSKKRKEFLVLGCGQLSTKASLSKGKIEDEEKLSDEESEDEENQTVSLTTSVYSVQEFSNRHSECFFKFHPSKITLPIHFVTNYAFILIS